MFTAQQLQNILNCPIARTLGLVRILKGQLDYDAGKTKRGWDQSFIESEFAWFDEHWGLEGPKNSDADTIADIDWLRSTKLEEDRTWADQTTFYIRVKAGICVAIIAVDACVGGWSTPKLFGNSDYPHGLISDKPTRGMIRSFCNLVGQPCD